MTGFVYLPAVLLVGGTLTYFAARGADTPRGLNDPRATAAAVWYAWDEIDCDDADYGLMSSCNDELQDVNKAPFVDRIVQKHGRTLIYLRVAMKGGQQVRERLTVNDRTGQVVAVGTYP